MIDRALTPGQRHALILELDTADEHRETRRLAATAVEVEVSQL